MHKEYKGIEALEWVYKDHKAHHAFYRKGEFANSDRVDVKYSNLFICLEHVATFLAPLAILLFFVDPIFSYVLVGLTLTHFVVYNFLHAGMHLWHRLPLPKWYWNHVVWNHFMHHQHPDKFFCVAAPGADWLLGSICRMTMEDRVVWETLQKRILINPDQDKNNMSKFNLCKIPQLIHYIQTATTDGELVDPPTMEQREFGLKIARFFTQWQLKKVIIEGELPEGQCILASNHPGWMELFLFPQLDKRLIRVMAHETVLKFNPILGYFFPKYFGFYSAATYKAVNSSIELLKQGHTILICGEGWAWLPGDETKPFKTGIARIAKATNIPVVPLFIRYKKCPGRWILRLPFALQVIVSCLLTLFKGDVLIRIGKPIEDIPEEIDKATVFLREKVMELDKKYES